VTCLVSSKLFCLLQHDGKQSISTCQPFTLNALSTMFLRLITTPQRQITSSQFCNFSLPCDCLVSRLRFHRGPLSRMR
jgi:hypothetical protein